MVWTRDLFPTNARRRSRRAQIIFLWAVAIVVGEAAFSIPYDADNRFDYPPQVLEQFHAERWSPQANLVCKENENHYGRDLALLLQRSKLERLSPNSLCGRTYVWYPHIPGGEGPGSSLQKRMALANQALQWGARVVHMPTSSLHFSHDHGWFNTGFWELLFGFSIEEPCIDDLRIWCGLSLNMTFTGPGIWSNMSTTTEKTTKKSKTKTTKIMETVETLNWAYINDESDVLERSSRWWFKRDPEWARGKCSDGNVRCKAIYDLKEKTGQETNNLFGRLGQERLSTHFPNATWVVRVESDNGENVASFNQRGTKLHEFYERMRKEVPLTAPGIELGFPRKLNFVVHIRTGHGQQKGPSDANAAPMVKTVLQTLLQHNVSVRLLCYTEQYSEKLGNISAAASDLGVEVQVFGDLNRYLFFHAMTQADILVGGHSAFSHIAAVVNRQKVLYVTSREEEFTYIQNAIGWNPCMTQDMLTAVKSGSVDKSSSQYTKLWRLPKSHSHCREIGLDLGVLNRKVTGIADWYHKLF